MADKTDRPIFSNVPSGSGTAGPWQTLGVAADATGSGVSARVYTRAQNPPGKLIADAAALAATASDFLGQIAVQLSPLPMCIHLGNGAGGWTAYEAGSMTSVWGAITGTLADQTDLQAALDALQAEINVLDTETAAAALTATWGSIAGTLSGQTDLQAALDALTAAISALDAATAAALAGKANTSHQHAAADTTSGTFASARIPIAGSGTIGGVMRNPGGAGEFMTGFDASGVPTYAIPAGAGSGTVTSVAVSGTDGLEVDSGSPITTTGTIQLGVNAAAMRAHLAVEAGATLLGNATFATTFEALREAVAAANADGVSRTIVLDGDIVFTDHLHRYGAGNVNQKIPSHVSVQVTPESSLDFGWNILHCKNTDITSSSGMLFTIENHGLLTQDMVMMRSNGPLPWYTTTDQLVKEKGYYVIKDTDNTFRLASTRANAIAGTALGFSSASIVDIWFFRCIDGAAAYWLSPDTDYLRINCANHRLADGQRFYFWLNESTSRLPAGTSPSNGAKISWGNGPYATSGSATISAMSISGEELIITHSSFAAIAVKNLVTLESIQNAALAEVFLSSGAAQHSLTGMYRVTASTDTETRVAIPAGLTLTDTVTSGTIFLAIGSEGAAPGRTHYYAKVIDVNNFELQTIRGDDSSRVQIGANGVPIGNDIAFLAGWEMHSEGPFYADPVKQIFYNFSDGADARAKRQLIMRPPIFGSFGGRGTSVNWWCGDGLAPQWTSHLYNGMGLNSSAGTPIGENPRFDDVTRGVRAALGCLQYVSGAEITTGGSNDYSWYTSDMQAHTEFQNGVYRIHDRVVLRRSRSFDVKVKGEAMLLYDLWEDVPTSVDWEESTTFDGPAYIGLEVEGDATYGLDIEGLRLIGTTRNPANSAAFAISGGAELDFAKIHNFDIKHFAKYGIFLGPTNVNHPNFDQFDIQSSSHPAGIAVKGRVSAGSLKAKFANYTINSPGVIGGQADLSRAFDFETLTEIEIGKGHIEQCVAGIESKAGFYGTIACQDNDSGTEHDMLIVPIGGNNVEIWPCMSAKFAVSAFGAGAGNEFVLTLSSTATSHPLIAVSPGGSAVGMFIVIYGAETAVSGTSPLGNGWKVKALGGSSGAWTVTIDGMGAIGGAIGANCKVARASPLQRYRTIGDWIGFPSRVTGNTAAGGLALDTNYFLTNHIIRDFNWRRMQDDGGYLRLNIPAHGWVTGNLVYFVPPANGNPTSLSLTAGHEFVPEVTGGTPLSFNVPYWVERIDDNALYLLHTDPDIVAAGAGTRVGFDLTAGAEYSAVDGNGIIGDEARYYLFGGVCKIATTAENAVDGTSTTVTGTSTLVTGTAGLAQAPRWLYRETDGAAVLSCPGFHVDLNTRSSTSAASTAVAGAVAMFRDSSLTIPENPWDISSSDPLIVADFDYTASTSFATIPPTFNFRVRHV